MPSGSPRGSIGSNTTGNVSTRGGGTQSGGAFGNVVGSNSGGREAKLSGGFGGGMSQNAAIGTANRSTSDRDAAYGGSGGAVGNIGGSNSSGSRMSGSMSANAAIGTANSTTAGRNQAYGGSGGALGTIGSGNGTGFRGPIGGDGRPRTNYVGTGGNISVANAVSSTTGSFDPYAAARRGMYGNQQKFQRDTYSKLGARQPDINPIFSGKLFGGLVAAGNLGIPFGESPFGYDDDTLGRTPEQAAQNKANALQRAFVYNGKTYTPNKGKIMAAGPYTSPHVFGLAADIEAGPLRDYMKDNAGILGLETIPGDRPHVQLAGTRALSKTKGGLRSQYAQIKQGPVSIASYAGLQPSNQKVASLGPIAKSAAPPPSGPSFAPPSAFAQAPPIPQRNPMRTNIPVPTPKPTAGAIAAQGIPTPTMAPGGFFPGEIDAAMRAQTQQPQSFDPAAAARRGLRPAAGPIPNPPAPREANPMVSSTPATMEDYNRVIAALEQANAREQGLSAPQLHPDRRQELAARRTAPQPLLNTRSATAVEGNQPVASVPMSDAGIEGIRRQTQAYQALAHQLQERIGGTGYGNPSPAPIGLSGSPPTRAPYYGQGDMSEAETYAGPFDPRMGTDAIIDGLPPPDKAPDQTQYKAPAAPPVSTPAPIQDVKPHPDFYKQPFFQPGPYMQPRGVPEAMPGETIGGSQIADSSLPGSDQAIDTAYDMYQQNRDRLRMGADINQPRIDTAANPLGSTEYRRSGGRDVTRLARALRKRGEADSEREARELAEQIIDYSRITYS